MALNTPNQLVVSVYGPHAGEDETAILRRKMEDIRKTGFTFWLYNNTNRFARPLDVRAMAAESFRQSQTPAMWLIHPSVPGGAQTTSKPARAMQEFSADGRAFTKIDDRLSPVTGSHDGLAFVISKIDLVDRRSIDLSRYSDPSNSHVAFKIGNSTQIVRAYNSPPTGIPMKRASREVWAMCELKEPYCVFVR